MQINIGSQRELVGESDREAGPPEHFTAPLEDAFRVRLDTPDRLFHLDCCHV